MTPETLIAAFGLSERHESDGACLRPGFFSTTSAPARTDWIETGRARWIDLSRKGAAHDRIQPVPEVFGGTRS